MKGHFTELADTLRRGERRTLGWMRALGAVLEDLAGAGLDEFLVAGRKPAAARTTRGQKPPAADRSMPTAYCLQPNRGKVRNGRRRD